VASSPSNDIASTTPARTSGSRGVVKSPAIRPRSQHWPARRPRSGTRHSRCLLFYFLFLLPFVLGSAQDRKGCGEVFDRKALSRVRTACVDTSYLEQADARAVTEFVAKENQPRQLLSEIPWKLSDQCPAADAVIRVYFTEVELFGRESGNPLRGGAPAVTFSEQLVQTVLLIYDRASVRVLYRYRSEGRERGNKRAVLLKDPFSRLVKDLKRVNLLTEPPAEQAR
jgi:hypothetical protein